MKIIIGAVIVSAVLAAVFQIKKTKARKSSIDSYQSLVEKSYAYLQEQQDICMNEYSLGSYEKWFYDQETGELTFSDGKDVKLRIDYEQVGSVSNISQTWLWAWANPHLDEKVNRRIAKVLEYGKNNEIKKLVERKWAAEEVDGWEMTAIAAYLLKAKGAYRVPTDKTLSFMIFMNIKDLRGKSSEEE